MYWLIKLHKAIIFIFICAYSVFSQGSIKGIVVDAISNDLLPGANVILQNTSLGAATDINGYYKITGIQPGNYVIEVIYIGYKTFTQDIEIADKEEKTLAFQLTPDLLEGEVITVSVQAEGQIAAINQQINSNTIVNVISEEKIQELPDANAAESIGRLPGVSVIRTGGEANKVILRGLDSKFTVITIDGIKVPPTEATSRGVDLSTLSQGSLAGIELFKAVTPDKDGDALAGSINLVTKLAPESREIKTNLKGNYNSVEESANQYDFNFRYGERFFENLLGVQISGNLEKKIRSNERIDVDYDQSESASDVGFLIDNFIPEYTNETRTRNGAGILLDIKTPDDGIIRINNVYGRTNRDFFLSFRDYPVFDGGIYQGNPAYIYRDREQGISTLNSSIRGDNNFLDLTFNWGISFAESKSDYPYDYEMTFIEPGGMQTPDQPITSNPENLIPYANNNFSNATLYRGRYRSQENYDKDRTAFLDISKSYGISDNISGVLKIGGKYKIKDRTNISTEDFAPYYLDGQWKSYEKSQDGTPRLKDFGGSYFEDWFNAGGGFITVDQFYSTQNSRKVYGSYLLQPLIESKRLREWYKLNKNGIDITGNVKEVTSNPLIRFDDYSITERIGAGYFMNTLNVGREITVIAGMRFERESNDYLAYYMLRPVSGFPIPDVSLQDTTSSLSQTIGLPHLHIAYAPVDFMKIRLAAYKALARPDFNMRLERYIAGRPAEAGTSHQVYVGNSSLKTAQAWNYEINTSFFGNNFGLISLSAYYKEIKDMYHMLNRFGTTGDSLMAGFGIDWASQMGGTEYLLTFPYNSPKPTKVWGFEFEHQINFHFLPGLLKNIVLSYNASVVNSETVTWIAKRDSVFYDPPGPVPPTWRFFNSLADKKQKLEGMPEFFGNISLGYDIADFSGRISLFHQGEYNVSYSAGGRTDLVTKPFTRIDLALKQKINQNLAVFFNVTNLTDVEEGNKYYNRLYDRTLFNESEKYGVGIDFGVTAEF
jgi:TonB-dependent receptor